MTLSGLEVASGSSNQTLTLTPPFDPAVKSYTAVMPADAETLIVKADKNNRYADWGNTMGSFRTWCIAAKLYDVAQMGIYTAQVPQSSSEEFTTESPLETQAISLVAGDGSGEIAKQVGISVYVQHNNAVNTYSITVNRAKD